jgi:hypothetical protein
LRWTAFFLAALTGPRIGEIWNLRWEDLDLETGVIHIQARADKIGEYWRWTAKGKADRRVPMTDDLWAVLCRLQSVAPWRYPFLKERAPLFQANNPGRRFALSSNGQCSIVGRRPGLLFSFKTPIMTGRRHAGSGVMRLQVRDLSPVNARLDGPSVGLSGRGSTADIEPPAIFESSIGNRKSKIQRPSPTGKISTGLHSQP